MILEGGSIDPFDPPLDPPLEPRYVANNMLILQSKVYAVMEYHDQPLQYINRYYFQTKTEGDDHYDVIYNIMLFMGALPFGLWIGFIMFAVIFVFPQISTLLIKLSLAQLKGIENFYEPGDKDIEVKKLTDHEGEKKNSEQEEYLVEVKGTKSADHDYQQQLFEMTKTCGDYVRKVKDECYKIILSASNKWEIHEIPLLCLSISLNIALFAFHILSAVEIIKYGNDVLQSHQDSSKDHSSSPTRAITISFTIIIVTYFSAVVMSVYKWCKGGFDIKSLILTKKRPLNFRFLAAISITINIIHIVCYFMPYMLLAFVYNPLQTFVTYLALGLYVLCAYLLFWIAKYCITSYKILVNSQTTDHALIRFLRFYAARSHKDNSESADRNNIKLKPGYIRCIFIFYIAYFFLGYGIVFVAIFFSAVIIYVLTLGSLNDFEVIQNLVPPLLIGLLTFFVVKPTLKQAKEKFNLDDKSRTEKVPKEVTKEDTKSKDTDQQQITTSL